MMNCISSPALDDTQIARYIEGEADEAVIAHIQECPYCSERAYEWTLLQNRLRKQLYRFSCPTSMELGDYHLGYLPDPRKLVVSQHVRECVLCRRELAEMEKFLEETTVQTSLLKRITVRIARLVSGKKMDQEGGEFSSPPAFAGLRGKEDGPFIYQVDNIQIVIGVQDDVEQMGFKTLIGLVTGVESNDFTIQISQGGQSTATDSVDEIGNFIIPHLSPSHYKLILTGPNMEIHIPSLPVI
jgi:hypothetical protein